MSEVKRYQVIGYLVEGKTLGRINVVSLSDYDALAAQRDEGLARENQLREERDSYQRVGIEAQQRLAEAEKAHPENWTDKQVLEFLGVALRNVDIVGTVMLHEIRQGFQFMAGQPITQTGFASPDCADGEKAE